MLYGVTSESLNVTFSVPQGSILGPLLFLIYTIDDITKLSVSDGTKLILYADDLLYCPISSPQDYHLLHDVDTVQAYASAQYMTFNRSKCKHIMLVSHKRELTLPDPVIYLYGLPLESVSTFKYLGVLLTSDLSWSGHVKNACTKARQLIGL